jgi:hypothetical protein
MNFSTGPPSAAQQPMGPNQIPSGSWQRIRVLLAVDRLDRGVPQMNGPRSQMSAWWHGSAVAIHINTNHNTDRNAGPAAKGRKHPPTCDTRQVPTT